MYPIGQILTFDDRAEFQNRGTTYAIHVVDAPKCYENEDREVVYFVHTHITYVLPDETKYLEINNLVKKVQTHHHRTTTCRK